MRQIPANSSNTYVHNLRSERLQWVFAAGLYFLLIWRVLDLTGAQLPSFALPSVTGISSTPIVRLGSDATMSPEFFGEGPSLFAADGRELRDGVNIAVATLILEAAGEGFDGMVAVAEVIRNRAAEAGKNYGQICLKPYQFSCWNKAATAHKFLESHRAFYETAFRAWLASASSNLTRGATFYHANYVSPAWASDYVRSARIGRHIFYRKK